MLRYHFLTAYYLLFTFDIEGVYLCIKVSFLTDLTKIVPPMNRFDTKRGGLVRPSAIGSITIAREVMLMNP